MSESTKLQSSSTITLKDLKTGTSVRFQGQTDSDGVIAAGAITATR